MYADVDPGTQASVVLTEDVVAEGGRFLDAQSAYTPDQTANAATWLRPEHADTGWLASRLHIVAQARGVREIRGNFEDAIGARVPTAVRDADRLSAPTRSSSPSRPGR